ncbi:MAG: Gfo/Idh/MocA family oxidoreductase [Saprospiraceae bacterium]|nr:Gfo/Idh/MocA family oxidoreductase [Saprospiraceae bacterium]
MKRAIGLFGVGHLGKIHARCLAQLTAEYHVHGFYDPDDAAAHEAEESLGLTRFDDPDALIDAVDVIDVVSPTSTHFDLIKRGLKGRCHVFTEKPVTESVEQTQQLRDLAAEHNLKVQVGHVERYNPAFLAVQDLRPAPMFIEGHRLAQFNPRGTDVSVVLDLMIHDLDILVALIPYGVANIHASGVAVISDQADICNARIEFDNGAVANLTASRISLKNMRKLRMFQRDQYISIDFLEKQAEIIQLSDDKPDDGTAFEVELQDRSKWIRMVQPEIVPNNAILEELRSFHQAIVHDRTPDVTLDDALASLRIAHQILEAAETSALRANI